MFVSFEPGRRARGILAWLVACLVVGFTLSVPFAIAVTTNSAAVDGGNPIIIGLLMILVGTIYTLGLTAIPAVILVHLVRLFRWRRGLTDAVVPAGIVLAISTLILVGDSDQPIGWPPFMMALTAAIGGLTYWLSAARPRPPY